MARIFAAEDSDANAAWFDRYSLVHASFGSFCANRGVSLRNTVLMAAAFEVAERGMKRKHPDAFPHPSQDSVPNMVGDVLSTVVGFLLAKRR